MKISICKCFFCVFGNQFVKASVGMVLKKKPKTSFFEDGPNLPFEEFDFGRFNALILN